jgi:perosamine synthetase
MKRISSIAERHNLAVIEDACEALGGGLDGKPAGSLGTMAAFGFYPNKQITTGEGGMVTTSDPELATLIRSLRNQGRPAGGQWLAHDRLGYNYRIGEMSCALGLVQLHRLNELLAGRARAAELYRQRLSGDSRLVFQKIPPEVQMSWFVMVVRLADSYDRDDRQRIVAGLRDRGIASNCYFPAIHLQPFYRQRFGFQPGRFSVCEHISDRTIALPFHGQITEEEVEAVCRSLEKLL